MDKNTHETCNEKRSQFNNDKSKLTSHYTAILEFATAFHNKVQEANSSINCNWISAMKDLQHITIGDMLHEYEALKAKNSAAGFNTNNHPRDEVKHNSDEVKPNSDEKEEKYPNDDEKPNSDDDTLNGGNTSVNYFNAANISSTTHDEITDRIESIMVILKLKQYLDRTAKRPSTNTISTFDLKLSKLMLPLFDYFGTVFDPIYPFLEETCPSEQLIRPLLSLLAICKEIKKDGVYRLTHVDPAIHAFIKKQLEHTQAFMDDSANDTAEFIEHVMLLSTASATASTTKPIRFFIVNENLILPFKRKRSKILYDTIQDFFKKGDIYLVKGSHMIPYEIDYRSPTIIPVNNYFTKTSDFFMIDHVVNLNKSIFTDAELAMSVFIAFKELLPT